MQDVKGVKLTNLGCLSTKEHHKIHTHSPKVASLRILDVNVGLHSALLGRFFGLSGFDDALNQCKPSMPIQEMPEEQAYFVIFLVSQLASWAFERRCACSS